MNEHFTQYDISGELPKTKLNSDLISMQIQALQESLRRLVNQDNGASAEMSQSRQNEWPTIPEC
jgi:hypothetical protein